MNIEKAIKNNFSTEKKILTKRKLQSLKAIIFSKNLTELAKIFGTDKIGKHTYTQHYQFHFKPFRKKKIKLLEIGVGGYNNPLSGGNSLRMWKSYFKKGKIFAIDIYPKTFIEESRIKIFQGSQIDASFLKKIIEETGTFDLIVDDGSHLNEHVIKTFNILFPHLKDGGIYVIEDVQTSYWPEYGGTSEELNSTKTIVGYFKSLVDGLNYSEFLIKEYKSSFFDSRITSIHFYHNLIFIYKGVNEGGSNYLVDNQKPNNK